MTKFLHVVIYSIFLITASCSQEQETNPASEKAPHDAFFERLNGHCGKSYAGSLVSDDELDRDVVGKDMHISITNCSDTRIDIPFHIEQEKGQWDRSRTWVITKTEGGLRLKHDHRHEDGSEDKITQYGGDTADNGSADLQSFPVDQESIDLFNQNDLTASTSNIWSVGITEGDNPIYSYQMERVNRKFRVEFDLSKPIETPPPAWGHE